MATTDYLSAGDGSFHISFHIQFDAKTQHVARHSTPLQIHSILQPQQKKTLNDSPPHKCFVSPLAKLLCCTSLASHSSGRNSVSMFAPVVLCSFLSLARLLVVSSTRPSSRYTVLRIVTTILHLHCSAALNLHHTSNRFFFNHVEPPLLNSISRLANLPTSVELQLLMGRDSL